MSSRMLLEVLSVSKSFASTPVLRDVSVRVCEGEIVCLLGPSGCGKTTLLRIVAGLETADRGQVRLEGRSLEGVAAHRRGFGLMFQDYALFPHKDVAANIAFGLRMQRWPHHHVEARVAAMVDLVGLGGYEHRRVYELSGGEQQRVALARSLAPGPRLLMLDEPLGSLDRALREGLMNELRAILKGVGVTTIYVTHDQEEAFAVADRVVVMRRGRVVQQGSPLAVYRHPASPWVARFLGMGNLVSGRVLALDPPDVATPLGRMRVGGTMEGAVVDQAVTLLIRPEGARMVGDPASDDAMQIEGTVRECSFRGSYYRLEISHSAGIDLVFDLISHAATLPQPGELVTLALCPEAISLWLE